MSKGVQVIFAMILALSFGQVWAGEGEGRSVSVSIASKGITLDDGTTQDKFGGGGLYLTGALSNNAALRIGAYNTEHEDFSSIELAGMEFDLLVGTGLQEQGFKFYLSIGYFSEELSLSGVSAPEDFTGTQFGIGLGYNWDRVSLDFTGMGRAKDTYEDNLNIQLEGVGTGMLSLGMRF